MKYHLIAIGGTGMGALAGLLKSAGHEVRGSDTAVYPPMSEQLGALGVTVHQGFAAGNLDWGPEAVIVGNVCGRDHVEVVEAQRRGIPLRSMPEVLAGEFLAGRRSLVVAGTHGKSTTASLLARILHGAGRDPGFFIGAVPLDFGQGWRNGSGRDFVVEGDEYDTAYFDKGPKFVHYQPHTVILTSIELDHVDIFSSMEEVREAFRKLVRLIPPDGLLVANAGSAEVMQIARTEARCRVDTYVVAPPIKGAESNDLALGTWVAANLDDTRAGRCRFEVYRSLELYGRFDSLLVGDHNVGNAVAAIAAAAALGVAVDDIRRAVAGFSGVRRRQELRGIAQGVCVIDDYAHHPTAVTETLKGLRRRFPGRRLLAAFEPRSATSRRKTFQREFAEAFKHADALVVGKPFDQSRIPESERFDPQRLALEVHQGGVKASYLPESADIVRHLTGEAHPGDVVVVFSSGAFDGLHQHLLEALGDAVTPARLEDMADVHALLEEVGLPHQDIDDRAQHGDFLVLHNETGFVGCVGLEVHGEDAILRSLAVKKESRSTGYGWMLADTVINMARHRGVRRVYLLTETASDFFAAKFGFHVVVPSTISAAVAAASVFRERPETAVAMRLDL